MRASRAKPALAAQLLGLLALLAASAAGSATASPAATHAAVRPTQELAALLVPHAARRGPSRSSTSLRVVVSRAPLTEVQTVLPVVGHATDTDGHHWLRVRLPGRPNGSTGWIERAGTAKRTTNWHLVIDISRRTVVVYWRGHAVQTFMAVVGKPSTPTPTGEFFVEEALELAADVAGAPFALALSARSDVYQEFEGGPGQIALHGVAHIGGTPGTAVSHGCIRLTAVAITWLAAHIALGAPVTIRS